MLYKVFAITLLSMLMINCDGVEIHFGNKDGQSCNGISYKLQDTFDLDKLNELGKDGYRYYVTLNSSNYFINECDAGKYTWHKRSTGVNADTLVTILNSEGADGFKLAYIVSNSYFFIKNESSSTKYQYRFINIESDILAQLNSQGKDGYQFVSFLGINRSPLFVKDSSVNSKFDYQAVDAGLYEDWKLKGSEGYKYIQKLIVDDVGKDVFVRDLNQADAKFEYRKAEENNGKNFIDTANSLGKDGWRYLSSYGGDEYYYKPINCNGDFCVEHNQPTGL